MTKMNTNNVLSPELENDSQVFEVLGRNLMDPVAFFFFFKFLLAKCYDFGMKKIC